MSTYYNEVNNNDVSREPTSYQFAMCLVNGFFGTTYLGFGLIKELFFDRNYLEFLEWLDEEEETP